MNHLSDAQFLLGGPTENRHEPAFFHRGFQPLADFRLRQLLTLQVFLEQSIIPFRCDLYDPIFEGGRPVFHLPLEGVHAVSVEKTCDAGKRRFLPDGEKNRDTFRPEDLGKIIRHGEKIGVLLIELADENGIRDSLFFQNPPHSGRADFNPRACIHHEDGCVTSAQTAYDFSEEIRVSGRIEEEKQIPVALEVQGGRSNADEPFLFLGKVIGNRRARFDVAEPFRGFCEMEDCLAGRGLAAAAMSHKSDRADILGSV